MPITDSFYHPFLLKSKANFQDKYKRRLGAGFFQQMPYNTDNTLKKISLYTLIPFALLKMSEICNS